MAYNTYNNNPTTEGKISEFNSASFKMLRLHKIMDTLNELDDNLFAWNLEKNTFNYKLKFSKCENLFQEVESKLTEDERKEILKLRDALREFMHKHQAFKVITDKVYPYRQREIPDKEIQIIIEKYLSLLESMCRRLIDAHGMDTAYGEDEGLF